MTPSTHSDWRIPASTHRSAYTRTPLLRRSSIGARTRMPAHLLTLVTLLLLFASNFFLVNQRFGLKTDGGVNAVGPRDAALLLFLLAAFPWVLKAPKAIWRNAAIVTIVVAATLAVPLALLGIRQGSPIRDVMYETLMVASWLVLPCIIAVIQSIDDVMRLAWILVAIGMLVTAGVYLEVALSIPVVTGTNAGIVLDGVQLLRSTPSCWPVMLIAFALLLARYTHGPHGSPALRLATLPMIALIAVASLLTQSRTLLVGIVLIAVSIGLTRGKKGVLTIVVAAVLIGGAWALAMLIGTTNMGSTFDTYMTRRYSVFYEAGDRDTYMEQERRPADISAFVSNPGSWLLTGSALGQPLWAVNREMRFESPTSDVSFVQLGTRFGLAGLMMLAAFAIVPLVILARARRNPRPLRWLTVGLSAVSFALWVCALFGNVWSAPYQTPSVVAALALAIWSDRYAAAYRHIIIRRPFRKAA